MTRASRPSSTGATLATAIRCTRPHSSRGGRRDRAGGTMALADTVGAVATTINLPPDHWTTTLESKTNFIAAGQGDVVRAEATPLHRGRTTQVWQTRVTDATGRLISQTIQTQMVLKNEQ